MKRAAILLLVSIASIGASWAAFQALAPEPPPLSRYVPAGPLLYCRPRFFHAARRLERSPQKASWVRAKTTKSIPAPAYSCDCRAPAISSPRRPIATEHEFSHAGSGCSERPRALRHWQLSFSISQAVFGQLHAINTLADARKIRDTKRGRCHLLRSARSRIRP